MSGAEPKPERLAVRMLQVPVLRLRRSSHSPRKPAQVFGIFWTNERRKGRCLHLKWCRFLGLGLYPLARQTSAEPRHPR